jgi:hypothetical protein
MNHNALSPRRSTHPVIRCTKVLFTLGLLAGFLHAQGTSYNEGSWWNFRQPDAAELFREEHELGMISMVGHLDKLMSKSTPRVMLNQEDSQYARRLLVNIKRELQWNRQWGGFSRPWSYWMRPDDVPGMRDPNAPIGRITTGVGGEPFPEPEPRPWDWKFPTY